MKSYLWFFVVAVAAITGICWIPLSEIDAITGNHLIVRILLPTIDAVTFLLPYWLLPRRRRWLTLIPIWALFLWFTACIWYQRFWGDFPDLTAITYVDNFNAELFSSISALWKWRDVGALVLPVLATVYYFAFRKGIESERIPGRLRIAAIVITVVGFFTGQLGYSIILSRHYNSEKVDMHWRQSTHMRLSDTNSNQGHSIRVNGFLAHYISTIVYAFEMGSVNHSLSNDELTKIESFIAGSGFKASLPDSLQQANARKNIIMIVVESLNASVINAVSNGRPVAPTLMALNASDSVVSALEIETQIRIGGSGDGQLLANTGLYPLPRFSTSILLGSKNTFPGLPRILGKKSNLVIFADSNESWNETETFLNFGFDRVVCNLDYTDKLHQLGADAAMFETADSLLPTLKEPFFLELLTASMHIPFNDPDIPESMIAGWITKPDGSVGSLEKYYRMVNYFDSALGRFINKLKERQLFDNTMIFIVSDHAQNVRTGAWQTSESMVFMAINTGVGKKIDRRTWQIDVFPTILQLSGAGDSARWKGAGTSMLGPAQTEQETELAKEISELILRGDFFKEKSCKE